MKIILMLSFVLVMSCSSATTTTDTNQTTTNPTTVVEEAQLSKSEVLSVAAFKAKLESLNGQKFYLIDVRTPGEVAAGKIENSINLNYNDPNFANELSKLEKDKPLLLYCASGRRSSNATQIAKELGFVEIYDLQGGFNTWSAQ